MRQLLQIATTLLQNAAVITKCDVYYKLQQYTLLLQISMLYLAPRVAVRNGSWLEKNDVIFVWAQRIRE